MINELYKLLNDKETQEKIKKRLPYLFQLAELENSRGGSVTMEVGTARERIISAFLIYKFGEKNVETDIPATEKEIDVKLFGKPISIKTISGEKPRGIKASWTVDAEKSREFLQQYNPKCDIILVQINWGGKGGFYFIPIEVQKSILKKIGAEKYIKLPKAGTNPRGVEFSKEAVDELITDPKTKIIIIKWTKEDIDYNPYKRWIDLWGED